MLPNNRSFSRLIYALNTRLLVQDKAVKLMRVFVTYVVTFMEHGKVLRACFGLRDNFKASRGVWAVSLSAVILLN